MNDDTRLDDALARHADALLEGREVAGDTGQPDLEAIARQLHDVIAPHQPPDPAFRARLEQRLTLEWTLARRVQSRPWYRWRAAQFLAVAAALVLVLAVVLFALPDGGSGAVQGTAAGPLGWGALLLLVVIVAALAFVAWRGKR